MAAVTVEELAEYLGIPASSAVETVLSQSVALIQEYLKEEYFAVPEAILNMAVTQLGNELWLRRNNPGGTVWSTSGDTAVRLARDPLVAVYPLLKKYKGLGAVG